MTETPEKDIEIDPRLTASLDEIFNARKFQRELGQCLQYTGTRKIDGQDYDIYLPNHKALSDKTLLSRLQADFAEFQSANALGLQGFLRLSDTMLRGSTGKIASLALVSCPGTIIDDGLDQMTFDDKKALFSDILQGLAALHDAGLTHGCLSPSVVRREDESGPVKLCDIAFSGGEPIAAIHQPLEYQSADFLTDGTPGIAADLYAAGMIGYRIFLGQAGPAIALTGNEDPLDPVQLRQRIQAPQSEAPTAERLNPSDPAAAQFLAPVLARMIGRSGAGYAKAGAALQALDKTRYSSVGPTRPPRRPDVHPRGANDHKSAKPSGMPLQRKAIIGGLAVAIAAVAIVGGYIWYDRTRQAALDQTLAACRTTFEVPPGLQEVNAVLTEALADAHANGNADRLANLCLGHGFFRDLAGPWTQATAELDRANMLLALETSHGLTVAPEPRQTLIDQSAQLSATMDDFGPADLNSDAAADLEESVQDLRQAADDVSQEISRLTRTRLDALAADARLFDLEMALASDITVMGQALDAARTADALDQVLGHVAQGSDTLRRQVSALWLQDAEEARSQAVVRIGALPVPEETANTTLSAVAESFAALEALAADLPLDAEVAVTQRAALRAEFAAHTRLAEAAAFESARTDALQSLETAQTALAPATQALGDAQAAYDGAAGLEPQSDTLDTALAGFAEARRQANVLAQEAEAAAEVARGAAQTQLARAEAAGAMESVTVSEARASLDAAEAAANQGAWTQARTGWNTAAEALSAAVESLKESALAAKIRAESAARDAARIDTDGTRQAKALNVSGSEAYSAERYTDARTDYDTATEMFMAALEAQQTADLLAQQSGPRVFTIGSSDAELQMLRQVCAQHSLVAQDCSAALPRQGTQRDVEIGPFALELYEASVSDFAEFVAATGHVTTAEQDPSAVVALFSTGLQRFPGASWRDPQGTGEPPRRSDPVTLLSAADARAYCAFKGGRLPTVAEWEATARGPSGTAFPWGGEWRGGAAVWQGNGALRQPVTAAGPAATSGHVAMSGNAREWVLDGSQTALMGGSWLSVNPVELSATDLRVMQSGVAGLDFGVRCAKDLDKWPE